MTSNSHLNNKKTLLHLLYILLKLMLYFSPNEPEDVVIKAFCISRSQFNWRTCSY